MFPGMEMLACPNLAVSPQVMQHIVHVESSANPYAIGVVGGQLERQPKNLAEAIATVHMLDADGRNFSVGLAQVNRTNFSRYGLDSYEKAFNTCANLSAGANILADCHTRANGDWGKAFSCYYSGNFTTGFRDGYVQKVYASINREAGASRQMAAFQPVAVEAIALRPQPAASRTMQTPGRAAGLNSVRISPDSAHYRVALRSMAIDTTAAATVPATVHPTTPAQTPTASEQIDASLVDANTGYPTPTAAALDGTSLATTGQAPIPPGSDGSNAVFVPEVRGPNDANGSFASARAAPATNPAMPTVTGTERTHLQQEPRDAAFVF